MASEVEGMMDQNTSVSVGNCRSVAAGNKRPAPQTEPLTPQVRPAKKKKAVRFSDPGPVREPTSTPCNASTGITPHVSRTRLCSTDPSSPSASARKKSNARKDRRRRHTAPATGGSETFVNVEPLPSPGQSRLFQYYHFHDMIKTRDARRLRRMNLSEGMHLIESKEKAQKKREEEREQELARLKEQLSVFKDAGLSGRDVPSGEQGEIRPTKRRLFHGLSTEIEEEDMDVPCLPLASEGSEPTGSDWNSILTDDDTRENSGLDTPMTTIPPTPTDASAKASLPDPSRQAELEKLSEELERERREKTQFLKEWQTTIGPQDPNDMTEDPRMDLSSPPLDLLNQVVPAWKTMSARASDAAKALGEVYGGLSNHGFEGANAAEIIGSIGTQFRNARIELERAVPGETAQADFSNWKDILEALMQRINSLIQDARNAQEEITGCEDREAALRRQFDATLMRLKDAMKKNACLEKYSESVAEDMLHMRMKLKDLERDVETQESDKVRLQETLGKYREDVKMVEKLNSQLEEEISTFEHKTAELQEHSVALEKDNKSCRHTITDLRNNLRHEIDMRQETNSCLEQRDVQNSNLQEKIQSLEVEKDEVVAALEQASREQLENHGQEIGSLNARLAAVTTELHEVVHESKETWGQKRRLERRLSETKRLLSQAIETAQERASQTSQECVEWQRARAELDRDGDTEPDEDDNPGYEEEVENRDSFCSIGGQPITPAMDSRFKNVIIVRGKKRKRPDMSTVIEDELEAAE